MPKKRDKSIKIGRALHVSPNSGNLIVRVNDRVHIGENVYDKNNKSIGKIYDLFGPVDYPYIAVRTNKDQNDIINKELYVIARK
jgi:RNA-binding protein